MSENREDAIRHILRKAAIDPLDLASAQHALDSLVQELNSVRETPRLLANVLEREKALREALRQVRHGCLLNIRRAAFGPEIGVRYTEKIRADIANECWRLEQFIDDALEPG